MAAILSIPPGAVAVADYEALARGRCADAAWAYLTGGVADELTLAANRSALDRLRLNGRVLADLAGAHTRLTLFGQPLDFPILLAPVARLALAHPDGERAVAQGAAAIGAAMVLSTESSTVVEDVAREIGLRAPLWFQLYIQHDRGFTRDLIQRAEAAGCRALVVTVDAPVNGVRNREQRAGFRVPPHAEAVHLRDLPARDLPRPSLVDSPLFNGTLDTAATWRDVEWLLGVSRVPVLLKGILSADDAARAVEIGAAGLVVSNHGGRTLDTLPATIEALPAVAARVDGRVPLLADGGIRRGTDILKMLALGASAVLIGRPYVYGLAAAGALGVAHVLAILRAELEVAMALTGCATLAQIGPEAIWKEK